MPSWVGPVASYMTHGLWTTLTLALVSNAISLTLGTIIGTLLIFPNRILRFILRIYVELWRGLPIIIILYFVFFQLPILGVTLDTFLSATIGLSLWGSANVAEAVRGAVQSVPQGQSEASAALGFPWRDRMRYIILPQAARRALPPLVGLVVSMVQQTSLGAIIGLLDILEASQREIQRLTLAGGNTHSVPIFAAVLLIFFIVCLPLTLLSRRLERALTVET